MTNARHPVCRQAGNFPRTNSAPRTGKRRGQARASKRHELTLRLKAKDIFNAELAENTEEKDKKIYGFSHLDLKP